MRFLFLFFLLFLNTVGYPLQAEETTAPKVLKVGYIDDFRDGQLNVPVQNLLKTLNEKLPQYHFVPVEISSVDPIRFLKDHPVDFYISSSGFFWEISRELGCGHLATQKTIYAKDPSASVGSTFVVLNDRKDLQTLKDLKGKNVVANQPNSFQGWLLAQKEIKSAGYDPETFFKEKAFRHFVYPQIFSVLSSGWADVAILPTCALERIAQEGLIDLNDYRVINSKNNPSLSCQHSTDLYPGVIFGVSENISPELTWIVTSTLLSLPTTKDGFQWTISKSFLKIDELYKTLKTGPYKHLEDWSFKGIWSRWYFEILSAIGIVLFLIFNTLYLRSMVNRRTAQLKGLLNRQIALEKKARESQQRLSQMEKFGVISQMSGMLAHELQQPLMAINNYLAGLKVYLERKNIDDSVLDNSLEHININSNRISDIVQRVRSYAKSKKDDMQLCDLIQIAERALVIVRNGEFREIPVTFYSSLPEAPVRGQPLELELLMINLLKNACSAVQKEKKPNVQFQISEADAQHWAVRVTDNGPALSDSGFERLTTLGDSVKPEGLGMGLSLVRGIADSHGATLKFFRIQPNGIQAEFIIDKSEQQDESTVSQNH